MEKGIAASIFGVAVATLIGYGGESASAAEVATTKPVLIDMEGDSLIWGYTGMSNGVPVQSPNNPPRVVQATLQNSLGSTVTTQNNAVSGTTVSNSLKGQGYPGLFAARLASNDAQIVLSNYATNDSVNTSVESYTADMEQWVRDVKAAGKTPVLEEPNPSCAAKHATLWQYRDAMVTIAKREGVLLIKQYDYILSMPNWQSMLRPDCTHPTDALYLIKAQRTAQQLLPLVKTMQ
ncbi:SGNH/GDSL hydrolase family protein [Paraburkholderia bannensis]|uniref:SGNH/GDSL hydrolase family protein n=1 Tax=Paraburkholderia bannensis TaxID=765414 RepID=UPI002ABDBB44|nr:SGNH/GDSL hydrolase family protein [Paraburkholderia bannensis]